MEMFSFLAVSRNRIIFCGFWKYDQVNPVLDDVYYKESPKTCKLSTTGMTSKTRTRSIVGCRGLSSGQRDEYERNEKEARTDTNSLR